MPPHLLVAEAALVLLSPGGPSYGRHQDKAHRAGAMVAWGGVRASRSDVPNAAPGKDGARPKPQRGAPVARLARPSWALVFCFGTHLGLRPPAADYDLGCHSADLWSAMWWRHLAAAGSALVADAVAISGQAFQSASSDRCRRLARRSFTFGATPTLPPSFRPR